MTKPKPAGATRISSTLYLFKSSTNSSDCIISAHGGYISENRSFKVPANTKIVFYGAHTAVLNDPGIGKFAQEVSKAQPEETLGAGEYCRNYLLSKYQGAHAGADGKSVNETYQQIHETVSKRDRIRTAKFDSLVKGSPASQQRLLASMMAEWGGSILTIRNRWNVLVGVPLGTAIAAAQKEMPSLRVFHCVFCRSSMLATDHPEADVKFDFS